MNDFEKVGMFLRELAQEAIKIKQGDFYTKQNEKFLLNWKNEELEDIFKTGGKNIKMPMRKKKKNPNWFKFRKFSSPPFDYLGIWTGETRYALVRGFKVGKKINIFKRISKNRILYGYKAKYRSRDITKYINVNLGVSKKFLNKEAERIAGEIMDIINKVREKYAV